MRYSILIRNTVSDEEFFFFSLSQISEENETNEITVFCFPLSNVFESIDQIQSNSLEVFWRDFK